MDGETIEFDGDLVVLEGAREGESGETLDLGGKVRITAGKILRRTPR